MKKKLPLMLFLCLVVAIAIPASAQNIQLLQNNGFETWTNGPNVAPDNWINVIADTITATREASIVRYGLYSVNLTWISPTQANCDFLSDPIAVVEGATYACTTVVLDNDPAGRITVSFRWNTANYYPGTYSIDSPDWQQVSCTQVAPTGATSLRVGIRAYDVSSTWDGNATVYMDDINLWGPQVQGNQAPAISSVLRYPYPTILPADNAVVTATILDTDGTVASDSLYRRVLPNAFAPVVHDSIAAGHAYWFTIGQHSSGDSIEYYVVATDDDGARAASPTRGYTVAGGTVSLASIYSLQHTTNVGSLPNCYPTDSTGSYSITGIVVGRYGNPTGTYHKRFFLQEVGSSWNGIYVYNSLDTVQIGDSLTLTGTNADYYAETEFSTITSHVKHASGRPLPNPIVVSAANFGPDSCSSTAEPYEGMLIQINNLTVIDTAGNGDFYAVNGTDTVVIMNDLYVSGGDEPTLSVGQQYDYVRGIGRYTFGMYRLGPRFSTDVLPHSLTCTGGNIFNVEFSFDPGSDTANCWPSPDSGQMVTVCGIVTGVMQGTTPRFYMQDQANTAWGGIYNYNFRVNNSTDTIHTAVGDYIQLTARVKEYYGWTEFDSVSAFTLLGTDQPLPDTTVLTVSNLATMCDYSTEPFENILVRLNNITVVSDNGFGEFWVRDGSGTDSIRIDSDLWATGTDQPNPVPSVGAVYSWVVGIARWEGRQGAGYDRGWIILPRFASDYEQAVIPQPNIDKVWPINATTLAVTFDRVMDPVTVGNPANYSTVHGLSITGAVRDTDNHRKVLLTTGTQPNNTIDSLVVINVCDSTGVCMTTAHQMLFHSGFTSIAVVNTPGVDGDTSDFKGDLVTIKGVIVADSSMTYYNNLFVNDQSGPPYNGVLAFLPPPYAPFPVFADTVIMTARVDEYFQATELTDLTVYNNVVIAGHGADPHPFAVTAAALNADKEGFEGVLVAICDSFEVTNAAYDAYGFTIRSLSSPNDSLIIHKQAVHTRYAYTPTVGDHIRGITGVFRFQRGFFRLMPRYDADLNSYDTWCGGGGGCHYVVGDVNNNGAFNGIDVTYGVSYFKGGNVPPYSCLCGASTWYVAGDVNASCVFNGIDITYMVSYFKGGPAPHPCATCPPTATISSEEIVPTITPSLKARPVNMDGSQQ
jgi:predicted extracellular nuclease